MFGLTALDIESLNQDEQAWDALVEEFSEYRQIWRLRGVMPMLRALMTARHIAENLLATRGGERRLTDILHISELLQEAAARKSNAGALAGAAYRRAGQQRCQPADASQAISTSCKLSPFTSQKGWNSGLATLIARLSANRTSVLPYDRETLAAVPIGVVMSASSRAGGGGTIMKIRARCTWP